MVKKKEVEKMSVEPEILSCRCVVWRIGEIFAEFGIRFQNESAALSENPLAITSWQLRVETDSREVVMDEQLPSKSLSKVIKVKPSCVYLAQVRAFTQLHNAWGPWSPLVRTRSFPPVTTCVQEIGEDYVRVAWDRPLRDTTGLDEVELPQAHIIVSEISQFQLKVSRECDMVQEYCDEFPAGVRTYTLHGLRPGMAYIVFVRYATLIGTMKQWSEVCRFYTLPKHCLKVKTRGEDKFEVAWERNALPTTSIGYMLPDSTVHKYELTITGEQAPIDAIELPASIHSYEFSGLLPGSEYKLRLRSLTTEGRWGTRCDALVVRTAQRPRLSTVAVGETYASVSWDRSAAENESEVEWAVKALSFPFEKTQKASLATGAPRVVHAENLVGGAKYEICIRTLLDGAWGLWSDPHVIETLPTVSLRIVERGEDFLTVSWPTQNTSRREKPYHIIVTQLTPAEDIGPVLDAEVEAYAEAAGFQIGNLLPGRRYEIKVRAWQCCPNSSYEGWGDFSSPVVAYTLKSVELRLLDVGEDFAQLSWTRALMRSASSQPNSEATAWVDLKYEMVVGCLDTGEDCLIHRELLDTTYTITNLLPNTSYVVSVRACDEKEQWGRWCKLSLRTLSEVTLSVHEIGEDFFRAMWHRAAVEIEDENTAMCGDLYVSEYCLFVFSDDCDASKPHEEAQYPRGGNSEIQILKHISHEHTSFRVGELLPDRTYTAVIRAATSTRKWGLWSKEARFRTLSPFRIPASTLSIGENYVALVWNRDEHPAVSPGTMLGDYTIISQQLRVVGIDGASYTKEYSLAPEQRELKLRDLQPATAYSIQIRACTKTGEWGLWSAAVSILTRATITARAIEVAENYILVSWEKNKAANPKNYPTGKGFISEYHLQVSTSTSVQYNTFLTEGGLPAPRRRAASRHLLLCRNQSELQ